MLPYLALVACKCDLEGQRTVTEEDHQHLAHTLGMYRCDTAVGAVVRSTCCTHAPAEVYWLESCCRKLCFMFKQGRCPCLNPVNPHFTCCPLPTAIQLIAHLTPPLTFHFCLAPCSFAPPSYCTSSLSGDGVKACACRIAADLAGVPLSLEQLEHMAGPCRELPGRGTAGSTIRQGGAVVDAVGGLDDLGGSSVGASSSKLPLSPAKAPAPAMTSRSGGKYGFIGPGLTEGTTNAGALVNPTMHMGTADTRAVQRAITPPRGPAGSSGNVRASSADATPRQSRPMLSRGTAGAGSGSGRMPLTQLDLAGHQAVAAAANGLNMGSLVFETEDGTGQEGAAGWGRDGAGGGRAVPGLATAVQAALSTSDGGKTGAGRRSGSFAGAPLPLPLQSRQQASAAVPLVAADGDAAVAPFTVAGPHHTNAQQQSSPHPVPLGVALQDPCTMYSSDWGAAKGDVGGEAGSMEHAALGVGQCGVCPAGATPPLLAEGKRKGGLRVLACCWG